MHEQYVHEQHSHYLITTQLPAQHVIFYYDIFIPNVIPQTGYIMQDKTGSDNFYSLLRNDTKVSKTWKICFFRMPNVCSILTRVWQWAKLKLTL